MSLITDSLSRHLIYRLLAILLAASIITGCKIEITVPNSGQVRTESGAFFCNSGNVCKITVNNLEFDESFYAVPNPGFEFVRWKKKPRGFCGGSSKACHLFTSGFAGTALEGFLRDDNEIFHLEPVFRGVPESFSEAYVIPDPGALWVAGENMSSQLGFTADLTLNGHQDIVMAWRTNNQNMNAGNLERTPTSISVFLADGNRGYSFGNMALFGDDYVPLGGAAHRASIRDFNSDGYPDIAFAVNLEDGRPIDPSLNLDLNVAWGAETAVMMSNGDGTYRIDILGPAGYHHAIATTPNNLGTFDVITPDVEAGNGNAHGYRYENGRWQRRPGAYPYLQNQDFVWLSAVSSDETESDYLFSANYTSPDATTPTVDLYKRGADGWALVDQILFDDHHPPATLTSDIAFITDRTNGVIKYENTYITDFVIWEVEKIRLGPNDNFALLAQITGGFLPSDYQNRVLEDSDLVRRSRWVAFELIDDKLVAIENFMVDQPDLYQEFHYDVLDVNGDGYEDFIAYSENHRPPPFYFYSSTPERAFVYLNNQNKSLIRTRFPGLPWVNVGNCWSNCGTQIELDSAMNDAKGIYTDLDNDGILDIVYRAKAWQIPDNFGRTVRSQMPTIHWGVTQPFENIDVQTLSADKTSPEFITVQSNLSDSPHHRNPEIIFIFDETVIRNAGRIHLRDEAKNTLNTYLAESEPEYSPDKPHHTMLQLENEVVLSYSGEMKQGHVYSVHFEPGTFVDLAGNSLEAFQVDFKFKGAMVDYRTGERLAQ